MGKILHDRRGAGKVSAIKSVSEKTYSHPSTSNSNCRPGDVDSGNGHISALANILCKLLFVRRGVRAARPLLEGLSPSEPPAGPGGFRIHAQAWRQRSQDQETARGTAQDLQTMLT